MATNPPAGDGHRKVAVRQRTQFVNPVAGSSRSRDSATGRILDSKTSKRVVARVQAMTAEEFRSSLLSAGIITKSGKLAKPYRG